MLAADDDAVYKWTVHAQQQQQQQQRRRRRDQARPVCITSRRTVVTTVRHGSATPALQARVTAVVPRSGAPGTGRVGVGGGTSLVVRDACRCASWR